MPEWRTSSQGSRRRLGKTSPLPRARPRRARSHSTTVGAKGCRDPRRSWCVRLGCARARRPWSSHRCRIPPIGHRAAHLCACTAALQRVPAPVTYLNSCRAGANAFLPTNRQRNVRDAPSRVRFRRYSLSSSLSSTNLSDFCARSTASAVSVVCGSPTSYSLNRS